MILTIGAFDGFHRGHARLLERARSIAGAAGTDWGAATFYPHPAVFMGALDATLFTLRERELVRRVLGVPRLVILRFDEEVKNLAPECFWERLKRVFEIHDLKIDGIVMGKDFRFGQGRSGTAESLAALCERDGVVPAIVDLLESGGVRCSSTGVRGDIMSGEVRHAMKVLGYPWFFWSRVVHGCGRGRTMGFPTANFDVSGRRTLPAPGVYAAALPVNGQWHCGALSIGNNPTFGDIHELRAEVFILDFNDDIYGAGFPVLLLERLRPMKTFSGPEELSEQIDRDLIQCRRVWQDTMTDRGGNKKFFSDFMSRFQDMNGQADAGEPYSPDIWRLAGC